MIYRCGVGHPFFALPRPIVIGHRGCAGEAPENTLASFARGLACGAGILESDVHLTRDGVPVLCHDPDVARTTDGDGPIGTHSLSELQKFDAGYRFERAGNHPARGTGLRIPTLAEALAEFPDARFNLELKALDPLLVDHVLDVIADAGAAPRTLLTAESGDVMENLHAQLDARALPTARGASAADVLGFVRSALDGVAPDPRSMALQVPADFAGAPLVTKDFVVHAHRHGIQVHVWTINDVNEMHRLLDLGVDGLVTDLPGRLRDAVGSRTP